MAGSGTFTGYVPRLEMPIVAPPPASFSGQPQSYYQQLQVDVGLALSGPNGEFLDVAIARAANASSAPDPTLLAVTGGFVRYYPAGTAIPSPDNFSDPQRGVLMLATWIGDIESHGRAFPPDVPPVGRVYYVGVDEAATAALLLAETAKMPEAALRASWEVSKNSSPPAGTTFAALADAHNLRVMAGAGSVFVDPGTAIGKADQDGAAAVETYRFILRITDTGSPANYVSPLGLFRGAPYYDL